MSDRGNRRLVWGPLSLVLVAACAEEPLVVDPQTHVQERDVPAPAAASDALALEALPWSERIALEQALAAGDARHQPRMDDGAPRLEGSVAATFTARGARLELGAGGATLGLAAMGRAELEPVGPASEVRIAGPAVELARGVVTEWWRSLPSGLEHGMTIAERPEGEGALVLELALGGARAEARGEDVIELLDGERTVATYAHLVVLDADGARVPARLSAHEGAIRIAIDDAAARYPVVVDPLVATEEATLLASGGAATDYFGWSVALSADGSRALVGAPFDDTAGGANAGSARVFVRSGGSWTEEATLLASGGAADDNFGSSVALSADGSRALVGAPFDDTAGGGGAGSARVFVRSGASWTQEAMLLASGGSETDSFGSSVALSADGSRALVGAYGDNTIGGTDAGSARVFVRSGGSWTEESTLLAAGGAGGDRLGSSVALNADGSHALVGAPFDDTAGGAYAGSARVFVRSGGSWIEEATLLAAGGAAGDQLGGSVALSADGSCALVGAHAADTAGGIDAGSARVFVRSGGSWTEEATLLATGGATDDNLGYAVTLSADGSRALVGAHIDDTAGGTDAGSARVFARSGGSWAEEATLLASGGAARDYFGASVALSADGSRAFVGAYLDDTAGGANAGSARSFILTLVPPAPNGAACTAHRQCASGACVDGVCCASACGDGASDCQACSIAAGGTIDGTCTPLAAALAATVTCRAAAGPCDLGETCTATTTACPADGFAASSAECRASAGACDVAESCTGASAACPADGFASSSTECRASAGACDLAETCTGSGAACPADTFAASSTECRASVGACDVAETCSGSSAACPADALAAASTECRASAGACDVAETCSGSSAACPADALAAASTECRASAGACDIAETCSGSSAVCPADAFVSASTECRTSVGACDVAESCTGASAACPADSFAPSSVECRVAAGACDVAETCTGSSAACPADALAAASTECRASAGACDVADRCSGSSAACPADALASSSTECRAAAGACDVAETCSGSSAACPVDGFASSSTECAAAACAGGVETPAASCTGSSASCPAVTPVSCDTYVCGATACLASCGGEADCASGHFCMDDRCVPELALGEPCDEDASCASGACDGVCVDPSEDGGVDLDGGVALDAAVETDAATASDAALAQDAAIAGDAASDAAIAGDAGQPPEMVGGCGCRVPTRGTRAPFSLAALVVLGIALVLRRSRPRARGV